MSVIKTRRNILLIVIFILITSSSFGQTDFLFNQYSSIDFLFNPAKVASDKNGFYISYHNQWYNFKNNPKFYSASGHLAVNKNFYVGAGINKSDYGGAYSNLSYQLLTSWKGILSSNKEHYFCIGEGIKLNQYSSDFSDLLLINNNDPEFPQTIQVDKKIDFSAGIIYRFKRLKLGVSSNSLIGLVRMNNEFPYNKTINADLGFLFHKKSNKDHDENGSTQINFRGRFIDLNLMQIESIIDFYPSPNYGFGFGGRYDLNQIQGNSVIFHVIIKFAKDNWKGKKLLIGGGPELSVFNTSLDESNDGTYELMLGFEKPVSKK